MWYFFPFEDFALNVFTVTNPKCENDNMVRPVSFLSETSNLGAALVTLDAVEQYKDFKHKMYYMRTTFHERSGMEG